MGLNPEFIIKQGYLVKSPPLDESSFIRRRWRLRWFALYDNGKEDVNLYYFTNELMHRPKGKIPLVGSEVYKQRGKLHGYTHVINIQSPNRLYHLCSTQEAVHEDWLDKIRDHYIPNTEVRRRVSALETELCIPNPAINIEGKKLLDRTVSTHSTRSVVSNSDDEVDYRTNMADDMGYVECEGYTNINLNHDNDTSKCFTLPHRLDRDGNKHNPNNRDSLSRSYSAHPNNSDSVYINVTPNFSNITPSIPNLTPALPRKQRRDDVYENYVPDCVRTLKKRTNTLIDTVSNNHNVAMDTGGGEDTYVSMATGDEDAGDMYVAMGVETETQSKSIELESEDEGIGRSDSNSSGQPTSTTTSSRLPTSCPTSKTQTYQFQLPSNRNSMDNLLLGFVGPKIAKPTTETESCRMMKARSVGDLLCPVPPPRTSSLGKREGNI